MAHVHQQTDRRKERRNGYALICVITLRHMLIKQARQETPASWRTALKCQWCHDVSQLNSVLMVPHRISKETLPRLYDSIAYVSRKAYIT